MKFEDIEVGLSEEISHTITSKDIKDFVKLTGDDNRLHVDLDYASKTKFKKPVVHGMLGASFISTIIGTKIPGDGALWFSQSLDFLMPVRVGDRLTVRAEVIKKDESTRVVELQTDIYNQNRQKVTQGVAKVKVVEQEVGRSILPDSANQNRRQVALVVGGSGGIGSATSIALAKAGYDVAIHYFKNSAAAEALCSSIEDYEVDACVWGCDITNADEVRVMIDGVTRRLGAISILINCSTQVTPAIKFSELQWSDFSGHLDQQIKGAFNLTQSIVPFMESAGYGKIIHIDTKFTDAPEPNLLPYITAKSALRGFSKSIALDLASKGILVNMVSPGMTDTDLIADVPERIRMVASARTPMKRLASPMDIANVIVFLVSDSAGYLCGETIRVNGGQVML